MLCITIPCLGILPRPPLPPTTHPSPNNNSIKMDRPTKRPKIESDFSEPDTPIPPGSPSLASLTRLITPPRPSRSQSQSQSHTSSSNTPIPSSIPPTPNLLPSPIQLTHIRDLSPTSGNNADTVRLRDILGDPMIRECWQFNYLIDVDFLMSQFDEDVRSLVKVKVVHGSWKRDEPNRIRINVRIPNPNLVHRFCFYRYGMVD